MNRMCQNLGTARWRRQVRHSMCAVRVCIHSPVCARFTAGNASKVGITVTRGQGTEAQEEFRGQAVHLPLHPVVQALQPGGASCCTLTICSHFCAHTAKSSHDIPGFPIAELK